MPHHVFGDCGLRNNDAEFAQLAVNAGCTPAWVQAASGQASDLGHASESLEAVLAEALKTRMIPQQFEARLALGEIELKSGKTPKGRARLVALEKDANDKGFLLIARKAASVAKG